MTTLLAILESFGVFAVGLVLRLALFVVVVAAVATPILLAILGVKRLSELYRRLLGFTELGGLPWRSGLFHTGGHLWLKPEGARLRVGLDGLAQRLVPGVRQVSLAAVGSHVRRGDPVAEIVTANRRIPIAAPMDGTVARVNRSLQRHPDRLECDPYLRGWLVSLEPEQKGLSGFLQGDLARDWFKAEGGRLRRLFEQELGVAAADGGEPLMAPEAALRGEQWERITGVFL